ncbi:MAG: uracil-DNA glycosylase family protein [Candidatus Hydrogenedentes bacterium]|nr:uracil-DNA glycosylase family protein [Candidatus Hydrogenedentota bacterium]
MNPSSPLEALLSEVRACTLCAAHLPLGPRPILRASDTARILVIGQAPGTRAHETGIPWNDASGDRLRAWLGLDRETFYDGTRIAIVPMGFCYPGRLPRGGDAPPRPECAPHWHARVRALLPRIEITLLIGQYAQKYYLGNECGRTLTETVRHWERFAPSVLPMPHPSFRNTAWLRNNPWFAAEIVPCLRQRLHTLLQ